MKLKLTIITLGLVSILSCKKDCPTPATTTIKTQEELLTAKTWKADEIRVQLSMGQHSITNVGVLETLQTMIQTH